MELSETFEFVANCFFIIEFLMTATAYTLKGYLKNSDNYLTLFILFISVYNSVNEILHFDAT